MFKDQYPYLASNIVDEFQLNLDPNCVLVEPIVEFNFESLHKIDAESVERHFKYLCFGKTKIVQINGCVVNSAQQDKHNLLEWYPTHRDDFYSIVCVRDDEVALFSEDDHSRVGILTMLITDFVATYKDAEKWYHSNVVLEKHRGWVAHYNAPIKKIFESLNYSTHFG